MTEHHILLGLNYIDSAYIDSAQKKLGYLPQPAVPRKKRIALRRILALAAAVMVMASVMFMTAFAVSEDFRELVFRFLRVE